MEIKDIKPIPKYILKLIEKEDNKHYKTPCGKSRFYAYLTVWKKELIKVTVAVRHYKKTWYCKQVAFHGLHSKKCILKDIEYCGFIGMGYRVGWYDEGIQAREKFFEGYIARADDKYYDPWAVIVNLSMLDKIPAYKYSAYKQYNHPTLFKYLRLYEQYPQAEYLVKFGMQYFATSKMILRKLANSPSFRKWFLARKEEIKEERYYIQTILTAFKTSKPLSVVQNETELFNEFYRNREYQELREYFQKEDVLLLMKYLNSHKVDVFPYRDYFRACIALGLDMTEYKNRFPHDFRRWHDIRIDQYKTLKAEQDAEQRKELYEQFAKIAEKYLALQHNKRGDYLCILAKSPAELMKEGDSLQHCVGRMNYDQKFIQERSLIFFIRSKENPDTPFVTVEYSLATHKVLQCYGERDSKPDDTVLHYVNKVWLPYANRQLKQLSA